MIKRKLRSFAQLCLASVLIVGITGCAQSPVRNPFAGRQEPKLGELPAISAHQAQATPVANVAWTNGALAKQQRFSKLTPLIQGGMVYAADHTGKIIALDKSTGKKIWTSNTGKKYSAGPTLVAATPIGDVLLLATSDAKIVTVDAHSGRVLWEAKTTSEVLAPPAGKGNVVLVHAMDGSVSALNMSNGTQIWHVDQSTPTLTLRFSSAPVITGDYALVGFSTGKLLAFNLENGLIAWERAIAIPRGRSELQRMVDISADPVLIGDKVYVITYQGKLAAVNVHSGDLVWEREISSYQNMAYDQQHLYITDNAHELWAIDLESGATTWKQAALATRYITGPAVVNNQVVVADRGGYMHFVSPQDGKLLNRLQVAGKYYQSPLAMGQSLLVSAHNGKIATLHCADYPQSGV